VTDRAAIYARVSTEDQSVATQLEVLERAVAALGLTIPAGQTYSDVGVSGRTDSRPGFDGLREAIQTHAVDAVVVTKLDRIARSAQTALAFFAEAEAAGVRIIVTDQAIDTGTPAGRLTRTILAAVAEFEGDIIRERTQVAMDAIRSGRRKTKSCRPVGRPRRVTPAIVAKIAELRAAGFKWAEVAQRMGLPAETCRRSSWVRRVGAPAVENSPAGIIPPAPGGEPSR
jgi:DNA invertase Pin-like site-specific DNA recombinase